MLQKTIAASIGGLVLAMVSTFAQTDCLDEQCATVPDAVDTTTIDLDAYAAIVNPDSRPNVDDAVVVSEGPNLVRGAYRDCPSNRSGGCGGFGYGGDRRVFRPEKGFWCRGPARRWISFPFRRWGSCR